MYAQAYLFFCLCQGLAIVASSRYALRNWDHQAYLWFLWWAFLELLLEVFFLGAVHWNILNSSSVMSLASILILYTLTMLTIGHTDRGIWPILGTLRLRDNGNANRKRSISPEVLNLHIRDVVTPRRGRENGGQVVCFILIFYRVWSYWKRRILFNKSIYWFITDIIRIV